MFSKKRTLILIWIWVAIIAALSFTPGDYLPKVEWNFFAPDVIAHVGFYAVLFFLLSNYFHFTKTKKITLYISFFIALIYGTLVEIIQGTLIPGRFFDIYDILSNSIGEVIGGVCYLFLNRKKDA